MLYRDIFNKLGFKDLTEVQSKLNEFKNENILIVSNCGSGKTEASYFKMLEEEDKTILIEPMRTLADSLQERLNKYNKQLELEVVTIQHSNNKGDKFLSNKYSVTTIDQILSGYLMLGSQSAIRGKNVLISNLIFDEVQLFDTDKMLLTTINMLDEIYKLGRKFIIMTATMPSYLIDFLSERYNMKVVISEKNNDNINVKLYYKEELNYDKILSYNKKQIIICNTIKKLREVYNNLNSDRVIVLHSNYYNSDRQAIEKEVYKYFGKNSDENNKILLTTQIIEVGIDISCSRLYSASCRIDNLIQRAGRCCRWGGDGEIIVFSSDDKIYNKEIVDKTIQYIKNNQGINFKWNIQKECVNNILNDFYEKSVNKLNIKQNKHKFKECNRCDLIRDIQNFNLIVVNNINNITKEDFNRESISLHINNANKLKQNNELYILNKNKITKTNNVDIGDTVIIQGNNCIYDNLGFKIDNDLFVDNMCENSPIINSSQKERFNDYVNETWLHHSKDVRNRLYNKLIGYKFNNYTYNNAENIAFYLGLHDLGKLDIEWSRKYDSNTPLAHFPFNKKQTEYRSHALISAEFLNEYIDKIIYNVIAQHHKKIYSERECVYCTKYELNKDIDNILKEYGFTNKINNDKIKSDERRINKNKIITAKDKDYTTFLYLTGLFMETEIESINNYIFTNQNLKS